MDHKANSALLFILAIIFLVSGGTPILTGNVTGESNFPNLSILTYIGIIILVASFITSRRKSLDVIIIPTGGSDEVNIRRAKKAYQTGGKNGKYVISGLNTGEYGESETIYRYLKGSGVPGYQIGREEKSNDTLENAVYALMPLKGNLDIGIVSNKTHLNRFKYIINRAKEEDQIDNHLNVHYIKTKQTMMEALYGWLAGLKEKYRLREGIKPEIEKVKEEKVGLLNKITRFFRKIFSGGSYSYNPQPAYG